MQENAIGESDKVVTAGKEKSKENQQKQKTENVCSNSYDDLRGGDFDFLMDEGWSVCFVGR